MRTIYSALFGLAFFNSPIFASTLDKISRQQTVCFAQSYTADQLSHRPRQSVRAIALQLSQQPDPQDPTIYLNLQIETAAQVFDAFMICDRKASSLDCAVECDGGQAQIIEAGVGFNQIQFVNKDFLLSGGCGDDEETKWLAPTPGGDDVFILDESKQQQCDNNNYP